VHGVDEAEAFLDPALLDDLLDAAGDIDQFSSKRSLEPQIIGVRLHHECIISQRARLKYSRLLSRSVVVLMSGPVAVAGSAPKRRRMNG
jgi:hypothetical protein